tara:strand:+ start:389 stop:1441 length:1053 start_codon:yes stop_codon:yes gene_type:complete
MATSKNKRIKIESEDLNGKKKIVYIKIPDTRINKEAQLAYNQAFRDALQSGAVLRQKLSNVLEEQGVWDDEKEKQYKDVMSSISDGEKELKQGGITLSEARETALSMRKKRGEFRNLISERSSMDGNTAEGQADNERFSFLVYRCLLQDNGSPLFATKEEYEENANEPYVVDAAGELAQKLYGLDPDYETNLPESKFLTDYKLADKELRLINKDGHLIDIDQEGVERLVNEDGRFIAYDDDGESYYINREGDKIDEEGDLTGQDFSPFLDDGGKPIPVPRKEEAEIEASDETEDSEETEEPEASEETEEEEEDELAEMVGDLGEGKPTGKPEEAPAKKRGRSKKTQATTE